MRQLMLTRLATALMLTFASTAVLAVSFGPVQMRSKLGQPLLAEIPIYDADQEEIDALTVALASETAYRRVGLDRKPTQGIQIQIVEDENGQLSVQLQTVKPFNDPVLNVLLDANWNNGGKLVREFNALVDPPYTAGTAVQTIQSPTIVQTPVIAAPERTPALSTGATAFAPKVTAAKPVPAKVPAKPNAPVKDAAAKPKAEQPTPAEPPKPQVQRVQIPATPRNQRLIETGDNLSKIAGQHQQQLSPSPISLNQMMNAILRANPEAFINGNPNLLKRGSIVRLPDSQQVIALLPEDAADLLQTQWAKKIVAQPAPVLNAANKLNPQVPATRPAPTGLPGSYSPVLQGRLKIVPTVGVMNNAGSQSGASKSGRGQELRAENTAGQEEIAARQSEITLLKNQLDEAAKLQVESKRLIELQNSQIKQLTQRMQDLEKKEASGTSAADGANVAQTGAEGANQSTPEAAWYFSPYAVIAGMLLIAALLGLLLKRKQRPMVVRRDQNFK